ncbi:hypothetical protein FA13DRAFT_1735795 [Coprinellus micaceus]|uniref:Uncharacterized protein n=1 Tax=Coprinellus micaceus TaxID=71717 RepID=A0A4Y7T3M8_COPMI|nr:hypothetical protein FA13DRAFT_1735795 [Coprinellus micaceus]
MDSSDEEDGQSSYGDEDSDAEEEGGESRNEERKEEREKGEVKPLLKRARPRIEVIGDEAPVEGKAG